MKVKMTDRFVNLIASFEFWYAKKFIKLDKHYTFMWDASGRNTFAVKLLKKYPDVIVEYSNLSLDHGNMSFDFNVIANPNLFDVDSKKFKKFTNNVMRNIMICTIESIAQMKDIPENYEDDYENRDIDTIELGEEPEIYEESDPIPQKRVSQRTSGKGNSRRSKKLH